MYLRKELEQFPNSKLVDLYLTCQKENDADISYYLKYLRGEISFKEICENTNMCLPNNAQIMWDSLPKLEEYRTLCDYEGIINKEYMCDLCCKACLKQLKESDFI